MFQDTNTNKCLKVYLSVAHFLSLNVCHGILIGKSRLIHVFGGILLPLFGPSFATPGFRCAQLLPDHLGTYQLLFPLSTACANRSHWAFKITFGLAEYRKSAGLIQKKEENIN
jgi:hypothetical protein